MASDIIATLLVNNPPNSSKIANPKFKINAINIFLSVFTETIAAEAPGFIHGEEAASSFSIFYKFVYY
jgi:hypothetical protein